MLSTQWVAEMIRTGHSVWPLQNRLFRLGFTVNKVRSVQFCHTFARSLADEYQPLRGTNRSSTFSDIRCHLACEVVSGNDKTVVPQGNCDGVLSLAVTYARGTNQASIWRIATQCRHLIPSKNIRPLMNWAGEWGGWGGGPKNIKMLRPTTAEWLQCFSRNLKLGSFNKMCLLVPVLVKKNGQMRAR
jgi:hypothetical protein